MAPAAVSPYWPRHKRPLRGSETELVGRLRELTAIPALGPENGGQGEQAQALYLEKKLRALNPRRVISLPCPNHRVPAKIRPNLPAHSIGLVLANPVLPTPRTWG